MSAAVSATGEGPEVALPPAMTVVPLPETRKNAIYFFGPQGPHGALSNFSSHAFMINQVLWKSVEHYYQAQKFLGNELETIIRESEDPNDAKELAKTHEKEKRADWDSLKEQVMFAGLLAKFTQNESARNALLETKNAFLVEHSKKDSYWGDGHANGLNRQGVLLMEVRQLIRTQLGLPEPTEEYKSIDDAKSEAALKKMLAELMAKSDAIDEGIIESSAPRTKRRLRTRPGTASKPYRSIDGTPLFEKDPVTGGVTLIDSPDIVIPSSALTPAARTVTFLYQFEKRNRRRQNMLDPEDLEEDEEDEDIDDTELEFEYLPPSQENGDSIRAAQALEQLLEESELALVMASSLDDHTSDDFKAFSIQLKTLAGELLKEVECAHDEPTLNRILETISAIELLTSS